MKFVSQEVKTLYTWPASMEFKDAHNDYTEVKFWASPPASHRRRNNTEELKEDETAVCSCSENTVLRSSFTQTAECTVSSSKLQIKL